MTKIDYKTAGVDVTRGYEAVKQMTSYVEQTRIPGVLGGIGGFGGAFEIPPGYKNPVLISGTDGVGTKLQLAFQTGIHDTIGIDCVAMCVNDIVCTGAKPLFFLDYIGTGILEPAHIASIVKGISVGCIESGCALVGGETAEMPGFYKKGEYDLAGFSVGILEKSKWINGESIQEGDVIIGITSSGIHSNGYSLVRKLIEVKNIDLNDIMPGSTKTYGQELLTPTKLYVKLILSLLESFTIKGIAHITGGGWTENMPRMLPATMQAKVHKDAHEIPMIFQLLQQWGNLDDADMFGTFNMGIGMALVVAKEDAQAILAAIKQTDSAYILGHVEARTGNSDGIEII